MKRLSALRSGLVSLSFLALAAFCLSLTAQAQVYSTWTNGDSSDAGDFNQALDWSNGVPANGGSYPYADFTGNGLVSGAETVTLDSASSSISGVTFSSSGYTLASSGSYTLTLNSTNGTTNDDQAIYDNITSGTTSISAAIELGATTKQFIYQATGGTLNITGNISGAAAGSSISLQNTGTIVISGNNTYQGGTTVAAGTLDINSSTAIGSGTLSTTAGYTPTIDNTSGNAIVLTNNNGLTLNSGITFTGSNGANSSLSFGTGAVSVGINAARVITITDSGAVLTLNGTVTDTDTTATHSLQLSGAGTLLLGGSNNLASGFYLNSGTLDINNIGALGFSSGAGGVTLHGGVIDNTNGSAVSLSSNNPVTISGNFAYSTSAGTANNDLTFGSGAVSFASAYAITLNGAGALAFGGVLTNTSVAAETLTVSNGSGTTSASGISFGGFALLTGNSSTGTESLAGSGNVTITGAVTNGGSVANNLAYTGTGKLTLSGGGTYTGGTSVSGGGTLNEAGSFSSAAATTISGNSTLEGNPTLSGAVSVTAGTLLPGSPTSTGGTFTATAATLATTSTFAFTLNSSNDTSNTLSVSGALSLGTAILSGTDLSSGPGTVGNVFDLANYGSLNGTFAGLTNGSSVIIGSNSYTINYDYNSNNEIALIDASAVPEPGAGALLLGGLGLLALWRRRNGTLAE